MSRGSRAGEPVREAAGPAPPGQGGRSPRWVVWALLAITLVGLGLRLWIAGARPDNTRHFDERFSLRNVEVFVLEGSLEAKNAYYPNLSWLPQAVVLRASEGLHRATGIEALSVFSERSSDGWSKTAYYLARGVSVLWGVLGILTVFVLGRRLFGPRVGLAAAALIAALPPHIVASGLIKPDILVSLMVTVTFLWGLDAAARPTLGRFLLAGVGVGLAVSAKYTGVGAAFPVVVAALWGGWRPARLLLRRTGLLAAAGTSAVAVFFLLNPHAAVVFEYLPRLWGIMESKGEAGGGSHLDVLVQEAMYPVRHHGLLLAALAAGGGVAVAARLLRRGDGARRREAAMLLAYALGYPLLYAASTRLFKGQNILPVASFTALLAGWALIALWDRAARLWPALRRGWVAGLLALAAAAVLFARPARIVYETAVPSTYDRASRYLTALLGPPEAVRVYYEKRDRALAPNRAGHRLTSLAVDRLTKVPADDLRRADGAVFFADRLQEDGADFYVRRVAERAGRARRFEAQPFEAWGPELVVVLHGWETAGPEALALSADGSGGAGAGIGRPLGEGEVVSFAIRVRRNRRGPRPKHLWVSGVEAPLIMTRLTGGVGHYQTAKLMAPATAGGLELRLDGGVDLGSGVEVDLYRWSQDGAGGRSAAQETEPRAVSPGGDEG